MKRRSVQRAYEHIRPDDKARERMLQNILNSSEIPPAGKDDTMKRTLAFLLSFVMLCERISASPDVGCIRQESIFIVVDLPAPFGPTNATISPCLILKLIS